MFAKKIEPHMEPAVEEDADELTAASSGSGDDAAEETPVVTSDAVPEAQASGSARAAAEVVEAQAGEMVEEIEPEAEITEPEAEETAEETEVVEAQAGEMVEEIEPETEITEPEAEEAAEETEVIEVQTGEMVEEIEPEAEVSKPQDNRAWYVIHCYSGYENKVKHNLEQRIETMQMQDQIFQVVVPTEDEIEVRDGKRRVVERRVFPGYILVQLLLTDDSWYVVRNTPGVTGFVGMGNEPTPLRPEEVQAIMKRMEATAPKIKVTFKPGQKVRIIDGPFNEFIGVVDEIDMERAKVRVMVSFFGRDTPVELDFLQVEKT